MSFPEHGLATIAPFTAAGEALPPDRSSCCSRKFSNALLVKTAVFDAGHLATRLLRDEAPDVVVLCAGAMPVLGALHEQTWETFSKCWEVDAKSAFVWLREALTLPMKPGGHVIVVSSGAAIQGLSVSGARR